MKILITGGAGFIGSHLTDRFISEGFSVSVFDNLDPQIHPARKKPSYLNKRAKFIFGDVTNKKNLYDALKKADAILHYAAAVGVGQSMYKIRHYVKVNSLGTANLLDLLVNSKHKIKKVIIAGSMSSYGEGVYKCDHCGLVRPGLRSDEQMRNKDWTVYCPSCHQIPKPVATTEDVKRNCNSIYAITKKNQEDMILNVCSAYNIPAVSLRYFNAYGPRQSLSNPYNGVAAIFLSRLINNQPPIIYEDGKQSRDFVSVYDIAEANVLALKNDKANYRSINIGSSKPLQIKTVAQIIAQALGKNITPLITNSARKKDVRHCFADIGLAKKLLAWRPKIKFVDNLPELVDWSSREQAVDKYAKAHLELKKHGLA